MEDWRHRAACRNTDPELFFPVAKGQAGRAQTDKAKAICAICPVKQECLEWALETGQDAGIWGGLDEDERRAERSRRKNASAEKAANVITNAALSEALVQKANEES